LSPFGRKPEARDATPPITEGRVPAMALLPLAAPEPLEAVDAPRGGFCAGPEGGEPEGSHGSEGSCFLAIGPRGFEHLEMKENERKMRRNPREHRASRRGNMTGTQRTRQRIKALKSNHPWMGHRQEGRNPKRRDGCWRGKSFEGSNVMEGHQTEHRKGIGEELQHDEPHDRQRGATNPRDERRSKLSRRCKTAKMERDLPVAMAGRNAPQVGDHRRSVGVDVVDSCRWRGDL